MYDAENSIIKTLIKDDSIKVWEHWIKSLNNTSISDPEPQKKKQNVGLTAIFDTANQIQSTESVCIYVI